MLYKSKANRIGILSLAALALRIIDTVIKSGIEAARNSKQFLNLIEVNGRYQKAIEPRNEKQVSEQIKELFAQRYNLFIEIFDYVDGQTKSPDAAVKAAALLVFELLNKYGRNFRNLKIADQSIIFIRIIESLKKHEMEAPIVKILLTDKLAELDQVQLDYENRYLGKGNSLSSKVAPSSLRREMEDAIKLYVDELNWMTKSMDTVEMQTLYSNVNQRFAEVTVTATRKKAVSTTAAAGIIIPVAH